ncbi:hypothetical protein ACSTHF_22965, partial [Vibrio parahaemolyticus]
MTAWALERSREQQDWERERMQQRAALMALQSQCDQAQQQLRQWQALHPGLPERQALQQRLAQQVE